MTRLPNNPGTWPRLMRAETAAAYVDERSVESFLRHVGKIYPEPIRISGKGERWLKEMLDTTLDRLAGTVSVGMIRDIADEL